MCLLLLTLCSLSYCRGDLVKYLVLGVKGLCQSSVQGGAEFPNSESQVFPKPEPLGVDYMHGAFFTSDKPFVASVKPFVAKACPPMSHASASNGLSDHGPLKLRKVHLSDNTIIYENKVSVKNIFP
jgi:hypothetical protein